MANLKEIKNRQSSVQTTMQVTRAMQMIASNNLRKAQDRVSLVEDSFAVLHRTFTDLLSINNNFDNLSSPYISNKGCTKRDLLVLISSNRGLCGVFNSNVSRKSLRYFKEKSASGIDVSFLTIGKKGKSFLEARNIEIFEDNSYIYDSFGMKNSSHISKVLIDVFLRGDFDNIKIAYTHFFGASNQQVILDDFLPFRPPTDISLCGGEVICEPSINTLYEFLIPKILTAKVHKFICHSLASEHVSRMIAMQKATENADQLSIELNLMYNKLRQASVTNEILEIISGTNSLK